MAVTGLGLPATRVARTFDVTPMPLLRGLVRGEAALRARDLGLETLAQEALRKG